MSNAVNVSINSAVPIICSKKSTTSRCRSDVLNSRWLDCASSKWYTKGQNSKILTNAKMLNYDRVTEKGEIIQLPLQVTINC